MRVQSIKATYLICHGLIEKNVTGHKGVLFMLYSKGFPPESSNHRNIIIMTSMLIAGRAELTNVKV